MVRRLHGCNSVWSSESLLTKRCSPARQTAPFNLRRSLRECPLVRKTAALLRKEEARRLYRSIDFHRHRRYSGQDRI